jgi:hypothetical protein
LDKLEDQLMPVEEDELPQGVLDLMAAWVVSQRPMTGSGFRDTLPGSHSLNRIEAQRPALQREEPVVSVVARVASTPVVSVVERVASAPVMPEAPALNDRPSRVIEASAIDPQTPASEPVISIDDIELPVAAPTTPVLRNAPSATPVFNAPSPSMPLAPPLELSVEEVVSTSRDFLQVPFNKGAASGQVTITRASGDSTPNLVLSPSNAQVFEHLKEPFEQVRDNHWRLTDTADEQPRHGSHQAPDDEQEDAEELPA